jgi:hypothetical protein
MSTSLRPARRAVDIRLPSCLSAVLAIVLTLAPSAAAGILTLHASAGLGGLTKPGRWTPVTVEVDNSGGDVSTDLVVSWGDTSLRRHVTFASAGTKRFTVYLRTLEPGSFVKVRLTDAEAAMEAPVRVLPHDAFVTLCIVAAGSTLETSERCSVTLTPDRLPDSIRAYEIVDEIVTARDVRVGTGARTTLPRWRALHALEESGDLGLTSQVTRPMLRRGLPGKSARPVAALAALYVVALLGLGLAAAHLSIAPTRIWLALGAVIAVGASAAIAVGRIGASARITIHHSSLMQQLPGTSASLLTLRGVAEFPSAARFQLRVPLDDAMLEASAVSGRAEQRVDEGGYPVLDGEFGLGGRQAFLAEAMVDTQWLAVEGDDRAVRISNGSPLTMHECRFASGMSRAAIGELRPGATVSAERTGDVVGPLFSCVVHESPLSFTEPSRPVDLAGTTQVVVYRTRAGAASRPELSNE